MAIIYAFGTAPQAKAMGYGHLAGTIEGTEEEVLAKFEQMDVCLVKSAQIYGKPQGTYEFGVFRRAKPSSELHFYRPLAVGNGATWKYAGICKPSNRAWFPAQCREKAEHPFALGCEIVQSRLNDCITQVQLEELVRDREGSVAESANRTAEDRFIQKCCVAAK